MTQGKNSGAGGYTLYVSALDEARARGATDKRKARRGRPKKHLSDLAMRHLKRLEVIGRRFDKKLLAAGSDWIPDEGFVKSQTELAGAYTKLERSVRLAREAEAKAMGGLSDDDLLGVLRVALPRVARDMGEDEWRTLLSIGMGEDIAEAAIAVWKQRQA